MLTITQRIRTYSFLDRPAAEVSVVNTTDTDAALLSQIDSLLNAAAASLTARDYDSALKMYITCESLIYAHLDPQWDPGLAGKIRPHLPRDPTLFGPLLLAASQWLSILPVAVSHSPVQPLAPVPAQLLSSVAGFYGAGIGRVSANPAASAQASSDMHLATIFADQGNTAASTAAVARARALDPAIATALAPPPPAASPPPAAPGPLRLPGLSPVVGRYPILRIPELPISLLGEKQAGLLSGTGTSFTVKTMQWTAAGIPDIGAIENALYAPRVLAPELPDALMNPAGLWDRALQLPHVYFFVIPLAIAQCYQALGDYANAEKHYLQAAAYPFLNTQTEGPYLWVALARLYSQWGDHVYQQDNAASAATIYGNVILPGSTTAPSTPLYTLPGLAVAARIATALLPQLPTLVTGGATGVAADDTDIAKVLLKVYAKLGQIAAGLDYQGCYAAAVPVWTFSYLQQVALSFTQLALQAENEVINFWTQADQATLTQTQLTNQVAQANAQVDAARRQAAAAQAQATAYLDGLTLAQTRAADAAVDANEYARVNSQAILRQALAQQVSGGDDGNIAAVAAMAANMLAGRGGSGGRGTASAAANLAASQLSQDYQVDSMQRSATEMQQAATQAQDQLTAANAQLRAALSGVAVAQLEAQGAAQTLQVFDADIFTPQVWTSMGNFVNGIYEEYMGIALQAAKAMQQAYNFEYDASVSYIKPVYPGLVNGLLAAEALMSDIQTFTDVLIGSTYDKRQYVKQSISLASRYGYLFQTQLRKTGTMTFETTLDDFDSAYPGSYAGRIRRVDVSVQGIIPPSGISGTLSNNGISVYRLPWDLATPAAPSRVRLQLPETLVLSDYDPAQDGVLDSATGNQDGIFEGAGVAGSWTLSLPPAVNDINYGTLTDVVLTFLYEARFDPQLVQPVLAGLAARPGYNARELAIPLAWMYPDLFYGFVSSGTLTLNLSASDFPLNQTRPVVSAVSVLASMAPGTSPAGITMTLTVPGLPAVTGVTDPAGAISSQGTSSTWAAAAGGTALGSWTITLPAAANPVLAPGGQLSLAALTNLVLVLDYSFQPRA
jgi:tetratricopeptide (TPR) repeat protein